MDDSLCLVCPAAEAENTCTVVTDKAFHMFSLYMTNISYHHGNQTYPLYYNSSTLTQIFHGVDNLLR